MVKLVKKIIRKNDPYKRKLVEESHVKADAMEKKRFRKGYQKLKKLGAKLPKHQLLGEHTSKDKVEISRKVPKKLRREVAYHERVEYKQEKKRGMYRKK